MEVTGGAEEGFVREWAPCSHILNLIPPRIQTGIFSNELCLTCVDAVSEYIALGTNVGLVYWYDRKKGNIQRLRCEASTSPITYVKIVSTVDYMVGAGNAAGQVTVFQIPKEHPENVPESFKPKVEPKVERYTIGDLHKSKITAIEWSKNGMRLFSGDKNGVIIMTEIDFYMHLCKSMEIVNEEHEIVQMSYYQNTLLVSSVYRSIVCQRRDARWHVNQLGKKERKRSVTHSLCSHVQNTLLVSSVYRSIVCQRRDARWHVNQLGKKERKRSVTHSLCSHVQNTLLVSSVYRSIVCQRRDARWHVNQLGKKERKSLCALGAVFQHSYARGGPASAYCARAGLRLWRADAQGNVLQTLLFKEAISNPLTIAELLNPRSHKPSTPIEHNLGPLHVFREHFLVSHNDHVLYILDPRSLTAVAVVDDLRRILSVSVNKDEIFVLEGPRSLVRLAHAPEPAAMLPEEPINMMTKSLTTSIQQAVNTVRDLTHLDQTVPYISSVLEQPISMFTKNELIDTGAVASAEECFELPPIKHLPLDLSENVLESIVNEFRDVSSDAEEIRRVKTEELQRKLKLYNSIMEKKYDGELIHSSRRSRRREGGSGGSTPRLATPVRKPPDTVSYTSPCVMNISVYGNIPQQNDELLEKQIEEKEKILAKMLNLESLSIDSPKPEAQSPPAPAPVFRQIDIQPAEVPKPVHKVTKTPIKDPNPIDLVPKVVQLPNTWNLESIELKLDSKHNGFKDRSLLSPDENLDSEWEII
ncbi:WD repeat-containing protein CG11141 [Helicoverpa armigera]|uniref:WD repeat-containing protein CG11141 n=1 Tax=Helicoverpa armigera TaxID=29058 RepID=UPI003083C0E9